MKGGRTKYKREKRETKDLGPETHPWEGVLKEETFPNTRKACHLRVCGEIWNIRGQDNWKGEGKKKKKKQNPGLNRNYQQRNSPDPGFCQ